MMGTRLRDPGRVESSAEEEEGLGLLRSETVFGGQKRTARVRALHLESGAEVSGYEIHMGDTRGEENPAFRITERHGEISGDLDGGSAEGGRVWGTYIHGVFDSAPFRRHFINALRARKGWMPISGAAESDLDGDLDRLADRVRASLDMDGIHEILAGRR